MSRCTRCLTVFGSGTRLIQMVCWAVGPRRRPSPSPPGSQDRPSTAAQNSPSRAGSAASMHRSLNRARAMTPDLTLPLRHTVDRVPPVAGSRRPRQAGEEGQVMQLSPSAHTDTFCRDHLPPPEQWPEFSFPLPELRYPDRINCATELLDTTITRHGADRRCLLSPSGDW